MKPAWKKIVSILAILLCCGLSVEQAYAAQTQYTIKDQAVVTQISRKNAKAGKKNTVSKKTRDQYFSDSAFIGSSIGVGLKMYFDSHGKGFLGSPVMLVKGCYSFANDASSSSQYKVSYKGVTYKAKDAIAAAKVKKVFINMGTNDLWKPSAQTYQDYVSYIKGIRKRNPQVIIFIQGTTPMCTASNRKLLNNTAIDDLNRRIEKYCNKHKDMYYVDITKGMKDATGGLKRQYSSDGYVHLTMSGYKVWIDNLTAFVDELILQEQEATNAVSKAEKSQEQDDYDKAKKLVNSLKQSTKKDTLKKKLSQIEVEKTFTEEIIVMPKQELTDTIDTDIAETDA